MAGSYGALYPTNSEAGGKLGKYQIGKKGFVRSKLICGRLPRHRLARRPAAATAAATAATAAEAQPVLGMTKGVGEHPAAAAAAGWLVDGGQQQQQEQQIRPAAATAAANFVPPAPAAAPTDTPAAAAATSPLPLEHFSDPPPPPFEWHLLLRLLHPAKASPQRNPQEPPRHAKPGGRRRIIQRSWIRHFG